MGTLPLIAPPPPRLQFRFALPPSLGVSQATEKAARLQTFLEASLELRHATGERRIRGQRVERGGNRRTGRKRKENAA